MKTFFVAAISLIIGLAGGLYYGWSTGVVDGQTMAMVKVLSVVQIYGANRDTPDIAKRDMYMDFLTIGCLADFADGYSYSPMFIFMHPKADNGLVAAAVTWALDHPDTPDPALTPLKPNDRTTRRLSEAKAKYPLLWALEVDQQTKRREKLKSARASAEANALPPANPPPRE